MTVSPSLFRFFQTPAMMSSCMVCASPSVTSHRFLQTGVPRMTVRATNWMAWTLANTFIFKNMIASSTASFTCRKVVDAFLGLSRSFIPSAILKRASFDTYFSMGYIHARNVDAHCEWSFRWAFLELLIPEHATSVDGCRDRRRLWSVCASGDSRGSTSGTTCFVLFPHVLMRTIIVSF